MNLSRNGIKLILDFEGKHKKLPGGRYQAYKCPADVWTIYAGVTEGVYEGMIVTEAEGMDLFRKELAKFEDAVANFVTVDLNQNQFDALVSFAYNVGAGALAKSTLLKKLNKGDFDGAAAQFKNWTRGGGKVLPGLVRRRAAEAELFVTPPGPAEPTMAQAVDVPKPVTAALKNSRGIFGLLSALGGFLAYIFNETIALVMAAAAQIDVFAPMGKLLSSFGVTAASVAIVVALAGLAYAAFARLDDARKGANVK